MAGAHLDRLGPLPSLVLIPGCRLVAISGLGHVLAPVSPQAVTAVRGFLDGHG